MKALITSVSLLIAMVGVITWGNIYLHNHTAEYTAMLTEIKQEYEQGEKQKAVDKAQELIDKFEDSRSVTSMVINHTEVNRAESGIAKLHAYLKNDSKDLFDAEYESLMFIIDNLYSSEVLNLPNLF